MPYRTIPFADQEIYHVFNRGVAKMPIFQDNIDRKRLLRTFYYYQFQNPKPPLSHLKRIKNYNFEENEKIVEILCYCLMPNHFHLILRQLRPNGISEFMGKALNSYTKYFNTRHERVGPLLQGQFKAVHVETEEQLIHLSRYIHLNPLVAFLVKNILDYPWSSYPEYLNLKDQNISNPTPIISLFKTPEEYEKFVSDRIDYVKSLRIIEYQNIE